ncbi:glycosyltransferase [uncultured Aeromicrobium sp.]|uniref:glycosyltransferase n=1 Tax=uncultured Aeromicrobium sp. TaxID=337820 RepID=UPI0025E1A8DE|nr:glycosyltransferase [uncultured Aeromicrobium sp.]
MTLHPSPAEQAPSPRARYYDTARTAHIERLAHMVPADFLYTRVRADWDEQAAAKRADLHRLSPLGVLRRVWKQKYEVVEIPEPLALKMLPQILGVALVARASGLLRPHHPTMLVTYAIENLDPVETLHAKLKLPRWLARLMLRVSVGFAVGSLTRIAYGTVAARENLHGLLGERWFACRPRLAEAVVPALPESQYDGTEKLSKTLCFVGTFEERKGILDLLAAWEIVQQLDAYARLTILGKGPLEQEVARFAAAHPATVTYLHDPPRELIRSTLRSQVALALLSRRTAVWREQVGLPIVEALEQGCEVIASAESGIQDWLADHGHAIIDDVADAEKVAHTILRVLSAPRDPRVIVGDLPEADGRIAADRWMFDEQA